ncbi:hypothetical protein ANCCAN_26067 [Ancylostoma caninum]|uniref:Uncharacterized protein n=1 Tax=Ancylostoma caninum TaxID=29170 RepID=A0A368F7Q3_ANCCA|nr:hypothetical protein ANCCAN_26067 [Ancylostoma caninum]
MREASMWQEMSKRRCLRVARERHLQLSVSTRLIRRVLRAGAAECLSTNVALRDPRQMCADHESGRVSVHV